MRYRGIKVLGVKKPPRTDLQYSVKARDGRVERWNQRKGFTIHIAQRQRATAFLSVEQKFPAHKRLRAIFSHGGIIVALKFRGKRQRLSWRWNKFSTHRTGQARSDTRKGISTLRDEIKRAYGRLGSWSKVGQEFGITKGLAHQIGHYGHEPKDPLIRSRLGLANEARVVPLYGVIPDGAQAIRAELCSCGQWYISNAPKRTRCFKCSPYRRRKK